MNSNASTAENTIRQQSETVAQVKVGARYGLIRLLRLTLIALPVISLLISGWSWIKYGVDIPVYDDWRQYNANDMGRLDLRYLLTPHNDTLYSFGLLLDSLAFRFLDGNTVAYQLLSIITVLGGLLALQWKLLSSCIENKNILAISFSFTLLMLQPDTYWGWQNLAYHQAVPLVCLLGILAMVLNGKPISTIALAGTFALTLISGLTYISGAFSALALCFTFIIIGVFFKSPYSKNLIRTGLVVIIPALCTTAAQLWVILEVQHGTHRADAPMAYPWESDFWYFMLGKVGRSLMLPMEHPTFSLIITIVAVLATLIAIAIGIAKLNSTSSHSTNKAIIIFLSLFGIVFVYLLLISAGRTNLRPDNVSSVEDIFVYGFYRFHFFWITLVWPWLALLCLKWLHHRKPSNSFSILLTLGAVLLWVVMISLTNLMGNATFFQMAGKQRSDGISCIIAQIQQPGPVTCTTVDLGDISEGLKNGRAANASFARTLPILPIALGTNNPAPVFRLSENVNQVRLNNAVRDFSVTQALTLKTTNDPSVLITIPSTIDLSHCETINLVAAMTAEEGSIAQLFFMAPGHLGYSEDRSVTTSVAPAKNPQVLNFTINSSIGFEHEFRFDPVTASQKISITELEIRCRSSVKSN